MFRRRAIGGALESFGDTLATYFQHQQAQKAIADRASDNDKDQHSLKSQEFMQNVLAKLLEKNPQTASKFTGVKVEPGDIDSPISEQISKAHSPNEALTQDDILNRYRTSGGEMATHLGFGPFKQGTDTLPSQDITARDNERLTRLMSQGQSRSGMLQEEANKPNQFVDQTNPDGSKTKLPANPRTTTKEGFQTGLSAEQEGSNAATKTLKGEFDPRVVQQRVTQHAREAASSAAAEHAYDKPEQFIDPTTGEAVAAKWNPRTKSYDNVPSPGVKAGSAGAPKPLTATQVDQISSSNTAEVEGVKILAALKASGLDKSNDPLDPRWNRFLAATLKMSTDEINKSDIQQRTAYVQAQVLRTLMQGRPSKWIADIYMQHIPSGDMTGSKLKQVLTNVLQQQGERRNEIEGLTGRKPGTFKPRSGIAFEDWLNGPGKDADPSTSPAQSKLDALRGGGI